VKREKIGLFGGTFDPPHNAHLKLAELVAKELTLNSVYFIPSARHPLKSNLRISPVEIRFKMLQKAIENYPIFKSSRIEIDRAEISYTIDTLKNFCKYEKLKDAALHFILGSDNLNEIHLWKDPEAIFQLAKIVVLLRPGSERSPILTKYKDQIKIIELPLYHISSTEIRNKIHTRQSVTDLVPSGVVEIINQYHLYQ